MFLHMTGVMICSSLELGFSFKSSCLGGSVARAKAAKVSIIRFTQSICTEVKGESESTTDPKNSISKATMLTVS